MVGYSIGYRGLGATTVQNYYLAANNGTYTQTGEAASWTYDHILYSTYGNYSTTGYTTNLLKTSILPSSYGTYTQTGEVALLNQGFTVLASQGTYTQTGISANLSYVRAIFTGQGTYTQTGEVASWTYNHVLTAVTSNYAYTGGPNTILYTDIRWAVSYSTFSVTGEASNYLYDRAIVSPTGTYTQTGGNNLLQYGRIFIANNGLIGTYGSSLQFNYGWTIYPSSGTFTQTGFTNTFIADRKLTATVGNITQTGYTAGVPLTAVAAGGNWSSATTWSPSKVPSADDAVILASTSGNVTVDGTSSAPNYCLSLNTTSNGTYAGTLNFISSGYLYIGNTDRPSDLTLNSSMSLTLASSLAYLYLTSSQTSNITTAGKSMPILEFQGGGTYDMQDAITMYSSSNIDIVDATINTNNYNISTTGFIQLYNGGINAGTSTISCYGAYTPTGGIFNYNGPNSTLIILAGSAGDIGGLQTSGLTFGTVEFQNYASCSYQGGSLKGNNTFANLSVSAITTTYGADFTIYGDITITGTLTLTGTSTNRLLIRSYESGIQYTITSATNSFSYVDFQGINAAGAASWDTTTITGLSGDLTGNSGITFVAPIDAYYVSPSTYVYYTDSNWYTTSGGSTHTSRIPLAHDNIYFDSNSFPSAGTTFNLNIQCPGNISAVGLTNSPTLETFNFSKLFYSHDLNIQEFTISGGLDNMNFVKSSLLGIQNIYFPASMGNTSFNLYGAYIQFNNSFNTSGEISIYGGTLKFGNNSISISDLYCYGAGALDMNGTTLTITYPYSSTYTGFILNSGAYISDSTGAEIVFDVPAGNDIALTDYTGSAVAELPNITIVGGNLNLRSNAYPVKMGNITIGAGQSIIFAQGRPYYIEEIISQGVAGNLASMNCTSLTQFSLYGRQRTNTDYLNLSNIVVYPSQNFWAGTHSVDGGGNTGWNFTTPPVGSNLLPFPYTKMTGNIQDYTGGI